MQEGKSVPVQLDQESEPEGAGGGRHAVRCNLRGARAAREGRQHREIQGCGRTAEYPELLDPSSFCSSERREVTLQLYIQSAMLIAGAGALPSSGVGVERKGW